MKIRHPRLQMYNDSVAMNFASIGVALSVMFMNYSSFNIMACISGALFFAFMVGFTLWYWIGAKKEVLTSEWLSDVSGPYILYFLITMALKSPSEWWLIFALVVAICTLMVYLMRR